MFSEKETSSKDTMRESRYDPYTGQWIWEGDWGTITFKQKDPSTDQKQTEEEDEEVCKHGIIGGSDYCEDCMKENYPEEFKKEVKNCDNCKTGPFQNCPIRYDCRNNIDWEPKAMKSKLDQQQTETDKDVCIHCGSSNYSYNGKWFECHDCNKSFVLLKLPDKEEE